MHKRTRLGENIFVERAGSEPPHFVGKFIGSDSYENRSSIDSTGAVKAKMQPERQIVSPVTSSNESFRRHLNSCKSSVENDGISSGWYNDYKTQTFLVERPHKMDFKRSNSQYDNHIRQVRGIL